MSLPTFLKTWNFTGLNTRIPFVTVADAAASLMFGIKNYMVATMGAPVRLSCNGTTAPSSQVDTTDRWLTKANCTTRGVLGAGIGSAQSWVVITWAGVDFLITYQAAGVSPTGDDVFRMAYSPSGGYRIASAAASFTFTAATTDICTAVGHGQVTGNGAFGPSTTTTLPGGLTATVPVWIIRLDNDTFKLATSYENALAGVAIDITTTGTGTHTLTNLGPTQQPYVGDEVAIVQAVTLVNATASLDRVYSIQATTDRSVFRLWCYRNNALVHSFGLEKLTPAPGIPAGTVLGWNSLATTSFVYLSNQPGTHSGGTTGLSPGISGSFSSFVGGTARIVIGGSIQFIGGSAVMPLVGSLTGSSPIWPLLIGAVAIGATGWIGTRIDGFYQNSDSGTVPLEGMTSDDGPAGTRLMWIGTMMTPWNPAVGLIKS